MISGTMEDSRHPERVWRERILAILNERREEILDYRLPDRALLAHLAPFDLPEQRHPGLIVNLSDITDLREHQRQYRRLREVEQTGDDDAPYPQRNQRKRERDDNSRARKNTRHQRSR